MDGSRLDRRLTIQTLVEIQGADGQPVATWVDSFTVACAAVPVSASERFAAEQVIPDEAIEFRVRTRNGWRPSPKFNRIKFPITPAESSRIWELNGVAEVGRNHGWKLSASILVD